MLIRDAWLDAGVAATFGAKSPRHNSLAGPLLPIWSGDILRRAAGMQLPRRLGSGEVNITLAMVCVVLRVAEADAGKGMFWQSIEKPGRARCQFGSSLVERLPSPSSSFERGP